MTYLSEQYSELYRDSQITSLKTLEAASEALKRGVDPLCVARELDNYISDVAKLIAEL